MSACAHAWTREQPTEHGWYWFVPAVYWIAPAVEDDPMAFRDVIQIDEEGVRSMGCADLVDWPLVGYFCRLPEPPELPT